MRTSAHNPLNGRGRHPFPLSLCRSLPGSLSPHDPPTVTSVHSLYVVSVTHYRVPQRPQLDKNAPEYRLHSEDGPARVVVAVKSSNVNNEIDTVLR